MSLRRERKTHFFKRGFLLRCTFSKCDDRLRVPPPSATVAAGDPQPAHGSLGVVTVVVDTLSLRLSLRASVGPGPASSYDGRLTTRAVEDPSARKVHESQEIAARFDVVRNGGHDDVFRLDP